jgi:hypothetical protein
MSGLQFMNQDGEWESFPTDDEIYAKKRQREAVLDAMQVRILCNLCNEPVTKDELAFWIEGQALTWSCKKCHAVNESKPQA